MKSMSNTRVNPRINPRMVRVLSFVLVLIVALTLAAVPAHAATYEAEVEPDTSSIILVDRSGSTKDRAEVDAILDSLDTTGIPVARFDSHKITLDENYNIGGNSSICEAIDMAVKSGYTHITVITDGQQWPADYSALGIYSDVDIKFYLTDTECEAANALLAELQNHLVKSTLIATHMDGTEEVLMDDYVPKKYKVVIEIPDPVIPEVEEDDAEPIPEEEEEPAPVIVQCNHKCEHECVHKCRWWCWLALPIAILALLLALLHWLLGFRKGWFGPVVSRIKKGAKVLFDISGSMARFKSAVMRAVKKAKAKSLIVFGDGVREINPEDVAGIEMGGSTHGTEALKLAADRGWDEVVLVSDLGFNGEPLRAEDFEGRHFKKITVLAPNPYDTRMLSKLHEIADVVEVLPL